MSYDSLDVFCSTDDLPVRHGNVLDLSGATTVAPRRLPDPARPLIIIREVAGDGFVLIPNSMASYPTPHDVRRELSDPGQE